MSTISQKTKGKQGFASMTREKQREIASKGGRASQAKGTGHQWTYEEAREAGRRGGTISRGGRGKLSKLAEKAALTFMLLLACGSARANGINLVANGDFTLGNTEVEGVMGEDTWRDTIGPAIVYGGRPMYVAAHVDEALAAERDAALREGFHGCWNQHRDQWRTTEEEAFQSFLQQRAKETT